MTMQLERLDHFSLTVTDLDRSTTWYRDILGLTPRHVDVWWSDRARFVGNEQVMVAFFLRKEGDALAPETFPIGNHYAFRVRAEAFETFKEHLAKQSVSFREMDHGISRSLYFRDPDGYWLELTTYDSQG